GPETGAEPEHEGAAVLRGAEDLRELIDDVERAEHPAHRTARRPELGVNRKPPCNLEHGREPIGLTRAQSDPHDGTVPGWRARPYRFDARHLGPSGGGAVQSQGPGDGRESEPHEEPSSTP